jgi:hypothetical protein
MCCPLRPNGPCCPDGDSAVTWHDRCGAADPSRLRGVDSFLARNGLTVKPA